MESIFNSKSSEDSRLSAIKRGQEEILDSIELQRLNTLGNLVVDSRSNWQLNLSFLSKPKVYSQAIKEVISDIQGLIYGSEVITNTSNNVLEALNKNIYSVEDNIRHIEKDVNNLKILSELSKLGPEIWTPTWKDKDSSFFLQEENLLGELNPLPLEIDFFTGKLTLPIISKSKVYSYIDNPEKLLINKYVGGELDSNNGIYIYSSTPNNYIDTSNPWMNDSKFPGIKFRINLLSPHIFSKVSISLGGNTPAYPEALYWYPYGNELWGNLSTGFASWTNSVGVNYIASSSSKGSSTVDKITEQYLLEFSPDQSTNGTYTDQCVSTSTISLSGSLHRLYIKWRGLGLQAKGEYAYIETKFIGESTYIERHSLNEGLLLNSEVVSEEFNISRYILHSPEGTTGCIVSIYVNRPHNKLDLFKRNILEVASLGIDEFVGMSSTWSNGIKGQPGIFSSYSTTVAYQPEALFFEITARQENSVIASYFNKPKYKYDFTIKELEVYNYDFSKSGRWISKPKMFKGEPRKIQLVNTNEISSNVTFKVSLRKNESSIDISETSPIQIVTPEESLLFEDSNVVIYNPEVISESFESTDLSGKVKLQWNPYINKSKIYEVSQTLTLDGKTLEYDPNAVEPLIYSE